MTILDRALRMGEAKQFKRYAKRVDAINAWEPELELLDDEELRAQADRLREWVGRGAAIYVCGSLQGMAGGVHEALGAILGAPQLDALAAEGRYRRDVY